MKFAQLSIFLREISRYGSRNWFRSSFYSTNSMSSRRNTSPWEDFKTELYRRISPLDDSKVSIFPVLDHWINEGRSVNKYILIEIIKELRSYKRYRHALEVSIWMTNDRNYDFTSSDVAVRLDLMSKVQGIERAEKYFKIVPQHLKSLKVYGALLNCYVTARCTEKAETVMQKMRDLGFAKTILVYNLMLTLYHKTGNMEKFDILLKEMEVNRIVPNRFTLSIRLSAYAAAMDIERMDKIVTLMESDPNFAYDWSNYTAAAAGYTKVGQLDKALEMLKKTEARVSSKWRTAYNYLLTQYAAIGRKDEVLRVWSLYKKKCKVYNRGYKCFLDSLLNLSDFEMAEKILDEWESQDLLYDIQIPNRIICAYSKKGLFGKAKALVGRAIVKGGKPNAWTWYYFATGYLENNQPEKAVEMMKRAITLYEPLWKPSSKSLASCLEHLKGVGDIEQAGEFIKLLLDKSIISLDIEEKLFSMVPSLEINKFK